MHRYMLFDTFQRHKTCIRIHISVLDSSWEGPDPMPTSDTTSISCPHQFLKSEQKCVTICNFPILSHLAAQTNFSILRSRLHERSLFTHYIGIIWAYAEAHIPIFLKTGRKTSIRIHVSVFENTKRGPDGSRYSGHVWSYSDAMSRFIFQQCVTICNSQRARERNLEPYW